MKISKDLNKMAEFINQIYPTSHESKPVETSGRATNPSIKRTSMSQEVWNELPDSTKYQIGVAGLMAEDPQVEMVNIDGGVFNSNSGLHTYTIEDNASPKNHISVTYELDKGVVQRATEVFSVNPLSADRISIATYRRHVGFGPTVIEKTPSRTDLHYFSVWDRAIMR